MAVIALLLLAGVAFQAYVEHDERRRFPAPGQLVDIGAGRFIHLRQWGEANAGPTIILDGSAAMPSSIWAWIGPGLAERGYRVVAYDRPGMGWSHGPPQPRDARHAADALTAALEKAAVAPPYVVVGHSYGGLSARVFTGIHRDDVLALVLLDTTDPDAGHESGVAFATWFRIQAWLGHSGLFHLSPPPNSFTSLPPDDAAAAHAVTRWTTHLDTTAEELEAWDASTAQARAVANIGDLPVLVVAARGGPGHLESQRNLVSISTSSRFVQLDADHVGLIISKPHADVVIALIDELIVSAQTAVDTTRV